MMWKEFEEIAGYEVSYETYTNVIEPMYMALNVTKYEFVKMLNKKAFALEDPKQMVRKMRKLATFLFENCGVSSYWEEKQELDKLAKEYAKRKYNLDWTNDIKAYVFTIDGYAYRGYEMDRGCTYPKELVIGRDNTEYERIALVK